MTTPELVDGRVPRSGFCNPRNPPQSHERCPGEWPDGTVCWCEHHKELTRLQRDILDFASWPFRYAGAREQAVRDLFGMKMTRYLQLLNALLDRPAAMAYAPVLVARLRRQREKRKAGGRWRSDAT